MLAVRRTLTGSLFRKYHHLVWLTIFLLFTLKGWGSGSLDKTNFIQWPGAYFISLWALSLFIPYLFAWNLSKAWSKRLLNHLIAVPLFALGHWCLSKLLTILLERLLHLPEHYQLTEIHLIWANEWPQIIDGVLWYVAYGAGVYIWYFGVLLAQERSTNNQLVKRLANAEVQTLSAELNPHFLFNALNSTAMMVRKGDQTSAIESIAGLSDLLRTVLNRRKSVKVRLGEELELLNKYLAIEKRRYGDRVKIEVIYETGVDHYFVPKLLLQPIVENAFKHSAAASLQDMIIKLSISEEEDKIVIKLWNSHEQNNWLSGRAESVGLPNTVNRLRELYGANYRFRITQNDEGVLVYIELPKEKDV